MTIEPNHRCDECNKELAEGDECYCEKCIKELRDIIDERDERIAELEEVVANSI